MKPLLISINTDRGSLIVNPGDLKTVRIDGNKVTFNASRHSESVNLSDYTINDRLRPALRERYHIIHSRTGVNAAVTDTKGARHAVIFASTPTGSIVIFPKGVKMVKLEPGSVISVYYHGSTEPVSIHTNDTARVLGLIGAGKISGNSSSN